MTVAGTVADLAARLAAAGVPSPRVDAERLVGHVLGWSAIRMVLGRADPMPPAAAAPLEELARRRVAREPLQLLVGSVAFRHLDLALRPGVFVPRPETEVLAGEAVARLRRGGVVVEPCTGSGAVACAVVDEVGRCTAVATDSSPLAVDLARANAEAAGVEVLVVQGDLLAPVPRRLRGAVDVVVCNPPYLAVEELAGLEPEVRDHDPIAALVAGPTGHEVTNRLLMSAPGWLAPQGWLLLETADTRAAATAARARAEGYRDVAVLPDLTGRDRVVVARR